MKGFELDHIKDALVMLYAEYHNPGTAQLSGDDVEKTYALAVEAWQRLAKDRRVV